MTNFAVVDSISTDQWAQFVHSHAKGTIFHTPQMYQVFCGARHHKPLMLAALDHAGEVLALLVAVRVQTLPNPLGQFSSRSILYAEPLCRATPDGASALAALLAEHDARLGGQVLFTEVRALSEAGSERGALEQCGYLHEDYLNFLVELTQPHETVWGRLTSDCRRRIKSNQKKGMEIRDITAAEGVDILYDLLSLTFERAQIPLADKSLFTGALEILKGYNQVRIFVALHNGEPVGADISLAYRERVFAWYGGADRHAGLYPMESLNWNGIEWAQRQGYTLYDFGGAGWPHKPYGVRDFKAKFGGRLVNYGRYRKVYSPFKLTLAEKGYESLRKMINPQKWKVN